MTTSTPTQYRELLPIREVVAETALSRETIRRMIASGQLDAIRIGRSIRIKRASLDALLGR